VIFFGTSTYSAEEAMDQLREEGIFIDALRLKAFPFNQTVDDFIRAHQTVFVIEQNRDAQMRGLLMNELQVNPAKLIPVLNYDGMPITAHAIATQISTYLLQITPQTNELPASII
jgi:2-oxoglutarate ferredoxin oxidoreductase subunit alpha